MTREYAVAPEYHVNVMQAVSRWQLMTLFLSTWIALGYVIDFTDTGCHCDRAFEI